jgi:hypothetical protein
MSTREVMIDHEAIAGLFELAAHFDASTATVCNWAARHSDFPKPVADLAMGRVWDVNAVVEWYNDRWATDVDDTAAVASV